MKVIATTVLTTTFSQTCPSCGKEHTITVDTSAFNRGIEMYRNGERIQNAFPTFTPSEREFFITGICDKCWEEM